MAKFNSNQEDRFVLRDYHHAAKIFTSTPGYEKSPYNGFLFHVNISFNSILGSSIDTKDISVLVKSTDLPEVRFETETLNQYNRKRIVNKKIEYQPIKLTFHDDVANNVRNMWIAYNQYYSPDATYTSEYTWQFDNVYQREGLNRRYGLDSGASIPFINKIEIYSMGNHAYSKLLLVNPIISSAAFGEHDYSDGAKIMEMTATIEYESIIYSAGTTNQIAGFGIDNTQSYDANPSTLGINLDNPGSNLSSNIRVNTPIEPRALTNNELLARELDPTVGNVTKNNGSRVNESQYKQIKRNTAGTYSNSLSQFVFPDTESTLPTTGTGISSDVVLSSLNKFSTESYVQQSTQISSNGKSVATINQSITVSATPTYYSETELTNELIIQPVVPTSLTSAEKVLFTRSYPPLPSTDPRAKLPPYV